MDDSRVNGQTRLVKGKRLVVEIFIPEWTATESGPIKSGDMMRHVAGLADDLNGSIECVAFDDDTIEEGK